MSFAHRTRLTLQALEAREVPAVLDLTTAGSQVVAPSGAIVQHYNTPTADPIHSFVRLQQGGLGGLLGGLLGGTEQGYNTNARPLQYNENSDSQLTHALTLGEVPIVHVDGVAYREFLLSINQSALSPNLSLDDVRVFLGATGNLSGYNATTKRLAGTSASFDLDTGGDVSIRMNANLNSSNSSAPDAVLLIPDAAFAGASANTFVYLYSKFSNANGGFEEWGVHDVLPLPPPPPPPPPPVSGSLAGMVYVDQNRDGVWNEGESGMGGVTITLQGYDSYGNPVSLEVQTDQDGTFLFSEVFAGTYTLAEQPLFGYASGSATAGSEGGDASSPGQVSNIAFVAGDTATGYLFGDVHSE
jgi:hypothetical protein